MWLKSWRNFISGATFLDSPRKMKVVKDTCQCLLGSVSPTPGCMPAYKHCGLFSPDKRVGYYRSATGGPGQFFWVLRRWSCAHDSLSRLGQWLSWEFKTQDRKKEHMSTLNAGSHRHMQAVKVRRPYPPVAMFPVCPLSLSTKFPLVFFSCMSSR